MHLISSGSSMTAITAVRPGRTAGSFASAKLHFISVPHFGHTNGPAHELQAFRRDVLCSSQSEPPDETVGGFVK